LERNYFGGMLHRMARFPMMSAVASVSLLLLVVLSVSVSSVRGAALAEPSSSELGLEQEGGQLAAHKCIPCFRVSVPARTPLYDTCSAKDVINHSVNHESTSVCKMACGGNKRFNCQVRIDQLKRGGWYTLDTTHLRKTGCADAPGCCKCKKGTEELDTSAAVVAAVTADSDFAGHVEDEVAAAEADAETVLGYDSDAPPPPSPPEGAVGGKGACLPRGVYAATSAAWYPSSLRPFKGSYRCDGLKNHATFRVTGPCDSSGWWCRGETVKRADTNPLCWSLFGNPTIWIECRHLTSLPQPKPMPNNAIELE
jgi:hypothetical protein